ncbi:hypothetical protein GLW36_11970 [Halorubrum terrestre]|uniref:Death domain-containing protein n=1 Tax=Halorubrum distributum TaxID=29283 RepID=A0A6B1IQG1_9EURY|nr:hypothetical protein [Halorubrum terrestre]MYL17354.1 hypothetical protein [Halorubrum terrestre]
MVQGQHVATYVPEELLEDWDEMAEEMDMSRSEWLMAMVEAGRKKFDRDIQPDESKRDLRQRNTQLWDDYQEASSELKRLKTQLHQTERRAIVEFVEDNQGCQYKEIAKHLQKTRSSRLTKMLDALNGDEIEIDEEGRVYCL